jgi:hypothetical protein
LQGTELKERNKSQRRNIILTSRDDIGIWRKEKLHRLLEDKYENIDMRKLDNITSNLLPRLGTVNFINQGNFRIIDLDNIVPSNSILDNVRTFIGSEEGGELFNFLTNQKIKEPLEKTGVFGPEPMAAIIKRHETFLSEAIEKIKIPQLIKILSETKEISICTTIEDVDVDAFLEQTL